MDDVIERLRRLDPVPEQLPPLPIDGLLSHVDQQAGRPTPVSLAPHTRSRSSRRVLGIGALVMTASLAIVVVIGIGALLLLGHGNRTPQSAVPSSGQGDTPGKRELIEMLAVLRRPQTKADIDPWLVNRIKQRASLPPFGGGAADVPLMRRVITSWGEKLYLVAIQPPRVSTLHAVWERMTPPRVPLRRFIAAYDRGETLGVFGSNGGGGGDQTAANIQYVGWDGFQGGPTGGGYQYLIRVVPDGVSKVVFVVRGHLGRGQPRTAANPRPVTVTATVHDNLAAARIRSQNPYRGIEAIWYGTNGQVLKRSFWP